MLHRPLKNILRSLLILRAKYFSLLFIGLVSLSLFACKAGEEREQGGSCSKDDDCISGWICEDQFCYKGERSKAELAARKAAKEAEKRKKREAKEAKKKKLKPGEGRLHVRICPFYKNTFNSAGTLIATHRKTKKRTLISLQMEVSKDSMRDVFTFYSLPVGEYQIEAKYGVQVNGQYDTHSLKCDPKATERPCEKEILRIATVTPATTTLAEDLKKKYPCDWVAE